LTNSADVAAGARQLNNAQYSIVPIPGIGITPISIRNQRANLPLNHRAWTPKRSNRALLATKGPALSKTLPGEKPALLAAKSWRSSKTRPWGKKPALVACNMSSLSSLRQCDELQHGSSPSSSRPLISPVDRPTPHVRKDSVEVGKRNQWQERQWPWPPLAQDMESSRTLAALLFGRFVPAKAGPLVDAVLGARK